MQENKRMKFDLFKSSVCHRLKSLGDGNFVIEALTSGEAEEYYRRGWYAETLYIVAMVDYISRLNGYPLYKGYDEYRFYKLEQPIYPEGAIIMDAVSGNDDAKKEAEAGAIPEFKRFNIMEGDVRNVA